VLDYLIEEILDQQPEHIRSFLLQTAMCDQFTGSLCDALTGQGNGQQTLETLERANLFIVPLDNERCWYRYHRLFCDLLRQRLRQRRPDLIITLHERASVWYEQNEFASEAIEHSLRAEDFARAARLIEIQADAFWQRGKQTTLRQWLNLLPAELVVSKPYLCILRAWDQFANGQQESAEENLKAAEKALSSHGGSATEPLSVPRDKLTASDKMKIQGRVAAIRAFLAFTRGDVNEIRRYALQALEFLPDVDQTWRSTTIVVLGDSYSLGGEVAKAHPVRMEALQANKEAGNIFMTLIAGMKLAITLRELGQLAQVIQICQQQFQLANERGLSKSELAGWLLAIWGEVLAERNDLDRALEKAAQGTRLAESGKDVAILGWSYLCLTRVLFARGDFAGAEEIIRKVEDLAREVLVPPWITNLLSAWQLRIWLARDRLDAVSDWLENGEPKLDGDIPYLHEKEYIVLARFLLANGQLDEAANLAQRLLEAAEAGGRVSRMIEILIVQALLFQARSDSFQSMKALERTIALAQPGGFVQVFVDEGPPMARLLYEALSRGIAPAYVQSLLAAFPVEEPDQLRRAQTQSDESEWIDPLSEREIEVLRLVAQGLSRQEIASQLVLSLNTVKTHARNIYGKLGVHSQMQAVGKARALGLLDTE
jgi:LuxR family maltose regulon positive regulatory protein